MTSIEKIQTFYDKLLEVFLAFSVGLLTILVAYQVFTRYVIKTPSAWTTEMSLLVFPYATYVGAALAFRRGRNLKITLVLDLLSPKWRFAMEITTHCLALIFVAVLLVQGIRLQTILTHHFSPALNLPVWIFYFGITLGSFLVLLALVIDIRQILLRFSHSQGGERK